MKRALLFLLLSVALSAAARLRAADILDTQHIDLSANYNATLNAWQLTVRDEDSRIEYAGRTEPGADRVIVSGGLSARVEVSADSRYTFLGGAGTSVWVLPQTQDPELPFLGVSTENKTTQTGWVGDGVSMDFLVRGIAGGLFSSNRITLSLTSVSGPGQFFLYSTDSFGNPTVAFNTADGISSADFRLFPPAVHAHFNWAFSAPGEYDVTLVASGTLNAGSLFTASAPTTFHFSIAPEPGSAAFAVLGALVLATRRRARTSTRHHS